LESTKAAGVDTKGLGSKQFRNPFEIEHQKLTAIASYRYWNEMSEVRKRNSADKMELRLIQERLYRDPSDLVNQVMEGVVAIQIAYRIARLVPQRQPKEMFPHRDLMFSE